MRRTIDPDEAPRVAFVLSDRHPATRGAWHVHRRGQLVHATEGVIVARTRAGRWVVPPHRALWVPGGMEHAVDARRRFRLLTLYVEPAQAPLPNAPRVVAVDALLAALMEAAAASGPAYPEGGPEARLVAVLLDRVSLLGGANSAVPLELPWPVSPGVVAIAEALSADPADRRTLDGWSAGRGFTPRTAARRFVAETGMTFGRWRQQVRLLAALEALGAGASVTEAALAVGYEDVSAFIAMFKAALGATPSAFKPPRARP